MHSVRGFERYEYEPETRYYMNIMSTMSFLFGVTAGFSVAYILSKFFGYQEEVILPIYRESTRDSQSGPITATDNHSYVVGAHRSYNRSVADELTLKVRVLCWVMTYPSNHDTHAKHIKATWGQRCNKLIFMSTMEDKSLPSVKLPVTEGRDHLWAKTKEAFRYVYERHRREADWFLKADDDTYVVVENLRYMLADYNPGEAIYFGCRFKPFTRQGYMSGGAGYVLSIASLDKFVRVGMSSPHLCRLNDKGAEDIEMGICLDNIGVKAMDSRDSLNRGRFFPFPPKQHLFPFQDKSFWYWQYMYYPSNEGLECCSDYAISFHYLDAKDMYLMEYLLYHLRPYGISYGNSEDLPKTLIQN